MRIMKKFLGNKSGATAIEYGLIAGLTTLGTNLNSKYNTIATDVSAA